MYQVWECYNAHGRTKNTERRLGIFDEFEDAKSFAETSYRNLVLIPESERMSVCVIAPDGRVPYTIPREA